MTDPTLPDADERRREDRHRTRLRTGILRSRDGRLLADCIIRDRSTSGAKLFLAEQRPLPLELELEDEADHRRYDVRIIRRNGPEIGVVVEGEKPVPSA
ncbi:PilZ domain-containing protein [Pleomorphomonas oryzae]|uniref:PilZ domain-containing protein n=1 Tax=Pleomorphomonas oryzae TaxID=261934 RepID=UPI00146AC8C3|nr:PilZ domain-containing protein [Pleomorphomonas oryzae]